MSQPRMRKASAAGEVLRVRSTFVKASGDSSLNPNRQQNPRSRSKNKIPKNIRYDLDNALVGLCDVWFEDIKPHLIRNKIKVHIHGDGPSPASGDHKRRPAGAPGCSHFDPGAASDHHQHQCVNFADCYVTPQTASKAPCRRPPAPTSPASPLQLILQSLNAQQECKNTNMLPVTKIKTQKKVLSPMRPHQRHTRLTQTYTVIPADTHPKSRTCNIRPATALCRTQDKGSQTHIRGLLYSSDVVMVDKGTQTTRPARRQTSARVASNLPAATFDRCPGKTTLLPTRLKTRRKSPPSPTPLFSDSLIRDIEENRKVIKVLYYSPNSSKFNSSVTLKTDTLDIPKSKRKRIRPGKIPPWR